MTKRANDLGYRQTACKGIACHMAQQTKPQQNPVGAEHVLNEIQYTYLLGV
jgi:hypothetical protein